MSENLKTTRELAEELGVSKQAIQYHIKSLANKNRQTNDKGVVVLSAEEQLFIRSRVDKQTNKKSTSKQIIGKQVGKETNNRQTEKETTWSINNYLRSELEEVKKNRDVQLAAKDKQIENKDSQISRMQNLLDQQQRLALQDKKLLEEYKEEIKDLKSLVMPHHDSEKEEAPQNEPEQVTSTEKRQSKTRKWWIFGK